MRLTNLKSQPYKSGLSQKRNSPNSPLQDMSSHEQNMSSNDNETERDVTGTPISLKKRLEQVGIKNTLTAPAPVPVAEQRKEPAPQTTQETPPVQKVQKIIIKQKVKKYGLSHAIFRPLTVAVLLLVGTYMTISVAMNYYHGYKRDLEYTKSRHIDRTAFEVFQKSLIAEDKVELIIRNFNGELERRAASKSQLAAYIRKHASELEAAQKAQNEETSIKLANLFEKAFEDKDEAIDKYADWFFEWKRPYIILKEAISSTTSRLVKLGEYESLRTAVERDMSDYFMKNYKEQVLKPEHRDEIIVAGLEQIIRDAHKSYLATMAIQDAKMKAFLKQNTTYLETLPTATKVTETTLDWDAQRWKNPTYLMEDRAFDGMAGVGRVAVGGTLGALTLGPAINRGLSGVFMPLSRQFAASMGARITLAEGGAVAGTLVEPVGGTIVGAAIGVVLGFAADFVVNKVNEKFSRGNFIEANQKAIQSTIDLWQQKLETNIKTNTDKWYHEAKAGLILVRDPIKKAPAQSDEINPKALQAQAHS